MHSYICIYVHVNICVCIYTCTYMYIYQQWFFIRVYLCMFITLKTNICKSKYMPNSEESNNLN